MAARCVLLSTWSVDRSVPVITDLNHEESVLLKYRVYSWNLFEFKAFVLLSTRFPIFLLPRSRIKCGTCALGCCSLQTKYRQVSVSVQIVWMSARWGSVTLCKRTLLKKMGGEMSSQAVCFLLDSVMEITINIHEHHQQTSNSRWAMVGNVLQTYIWTLATLLFKPFEIRVQMKEKVISSCSLTQFSI